MSHTYAPVSSPDTQHDCMVIGEEESGRVIRFSCGASAELWLADAMTAGQVAASS